MVSLAILRCKRRGRSEKVFDEGERVGRDAKDSLVVKVCRDDAFSFKGIGHVMRWKF
jgi:hypothetical protein